MNDKILFVSNRNDFLLRPQDIRWVEQVFGNRSKFFQRGGHGAVAHGVGQRHQGRRHRRRTADDAAWRHLHGLDEQLDRAAAGA